MVGVEEEVLAAHKITDKEQVGSRIRRCKCVLIHCSGRSLPPASSASFNHLSLCKNSACVRWWIF